jgi:hypothetical protein
MLPRSTSTGLGACALSGHGVVISPAVAVNHCDAAAFFEMVPMSRARLASPRDNFGR